MRRCQRPGAERSHPRPIVPLPVLARVGLMWPDRPVPSLPLPLPRPPPPSLPPPPLWGYGAYGRGQDAIRAARRARCRTHNSTPSECGGAMYPCDCVVRRLDGLNAYRHGVSSLSTRYLRIGGEQGIYMEGGPGRGEGGSQREELELGERERTLSTLDVPPSDIYSSCTG